MTEITPQIYMDMNKEFEEDGTPLRIVVPTQETIDKWLESSKVDIHSRTAEPVDMVSQLWKEHRENENKKTKVQALIYSNGSQECERAKQLLTSLGQDIREFLLGVDFSDRQFRAEFGAEAEYPQISVGLNHRGSLKETIHFLKKEGMFM